MDQDDPFTSQIGGPPLPPFDPARYANALADALDEYGRRQSASGRLLPPRDQQKPPLCGYLPEGPDCEAPQF